MGWRGVLGSEVNKAQCFDSDLSALRTTSLPLCFFDVQQLFISLRIPPRFHISPSFQTLQYLPFISQSLPPPYCQHVPPKTLLYKLLPPYHRNRRHLPSLQVQSLSQSLPHIPHKSGMLPPHVLHVRRPNFHLRSRILPNAILSKNTSKTRVS